MFNVIRAELKKMVSRPGIYILAAFLAVILVLGVFLYNPDVREVSSIPTTITLQTNGFVNNTGYNKSYSDNYVTLATNAVNSYYYNGQTYYEVMYGEDGNSGLWQEYQNALQEMKIRANTDIGETQLENYVNTFVSILNKINDVITSAYTLTTNTIAFPLLTSSTNYSNYLSLYSIIVTRQAGNDSVFGRVNDENNYMSFQQRIELFVDSYQSSYEECISNFIFPTISESLYNRYTSDEEDSYLTIVNARLEEIYNQMLAIEEEYTLSLTNGEYTQTLYNQLQEEYNELANRYYCTALNYYYLVEYELKSNAYTFVSTSQSLDLWGLEDESEYNSNTQLMRYQYLFENDKLESDYANPLAVGSTITDEITAYDYAYFILKLFSFIIIAYAIMSACGAVAGEIKDGTMRYYAIRPIKRGDILFGKLLAIIIMSFIMIVFSAVIAMCVGAGVYGWTNLTILTIFNGTTAMTISPLVMMLLYIASFLIEVIVYTSIAMLLSCLLKSDLLASTIMLLIYLLNIILPVFTGGMNSWLAYYPFSHISLFALFGSSIVSTSSDMLSSLLKVNVYASTGLIPTIVITALLIAVPLLLARFIFNKKEL